MIRTVCAWVLVVLAASPVTAPFSTCDLRAFLAPTSSVQVASTFPSAAVSRPLSFDVDANSVSPIVPRHELPGSDSRELVMLLFHGVTPTDRDVLRPHQIDLSPHDRITRPTVLRL
jgi:hypothetical protein